MSTYTVTDLKVRLDKFLAEQLPGVSRGKIQKDIEAGLVLVNGKKIIISHFAVRKDNKIEYTQSATPSDEIKPTNTPLKILYNNHGLLIIDKPAGLVVHPGAGFKGETLASALLYHFKDIKLVGEEGRSGIVHRLDKDTSGVILIARTQEMYEHLKDAFAERKVKKEYIALVAGKLEKPHDMIDTPIGKSKRDFRKYDTKNMVEAKPSLTEYQVVESFDNWSLVVVKLHTGRTHQIRVHFSSLKHPLAGDSLYGGKPVEIKGLHRQFLHAARIEVKLPDGTWIEAESKLPDDLREVLIELGSKKVNQL